MSELGVAIAGVGMTQHGFFARKSWRDLVFEAGTSALRDAGFEPDAVDGGVVSVTAPETFEQQNLGPLVREELALPPCSFSQVVGACAGGTLALQHGANMIRSGQHECVLVLGVEKLSDAYSPSDALLSYLDQEFESPAGFDYVDTMALMHSRYMQKYGATAEQIASIVVQARWYGSRNKRAVDYGRPETSIDDVFGSGWASRPIHRAECARGCDGSSAVLLVREDRLPQKHRAIKLASVVSATGSNYLGAKFRSTDGTDIAEAPPTAMAAEQAYKKAGIEAKDIDLAQVHDCFSVMGAIHLEGLGVFSRGEAAAAIAAGETRLSGHCPTNTDGGRIGLGHPTGATGLSIIVESVEQLRGEAGERQVQNAEVAVAQSMGGNNAVSAVAVLTKL